MLECFRAFFTGQIDWFFLIIRQYWIRNDGFQFFSLSNTDVIYSYSIAEISLF